MFDAKTDTIKTISSVFFWILSICTIIVGFSLLELSPWYGLILIFGAPVEFYLVTAVIHTIADTNECVNQLVRRTPTLYSSEHSVSQSTVVHSSSAHSSNWTCQCGNINPAFLAVCSCGRPKSTLPSAKNGLKECPKCGESQSASNDYCAICGTRLY